MSGPAYRLAQLNEGLDLVSFDGGDETYDRWLVESATRAHHSGTARVFVLLDDETQDGGRVLGYFAICPTSVVRVDLPEPMQRQLTRNVPGWLIAKLAVDTSLRGGPEQWGRQLLREALLRIVDAADRGGGAVIVVDPDNAGLVGFYASNGFLPTGGEDLRMYLKVATARTHLVAHP